MNEGGKQVEREDRKLISELCNALEYASESVRKILNGETHPYEFDPQGWGILIAKAKASDMEERDGRFILDTLHGVYRAALAPEFYCSRETVLKFVNREVRTDEDADIQAMARDLLGYLDAEVPAADNSTKCACAYCTKDVEALADCCAEQEMQLFLPGGWKDRAEAAEARLAAVPACKPIAEEELERLMFKFPTPWSEFNQGWNEALDTVLSRLREVQSQGNTEKGGKK